MVIAGYIPETVTNWQDVAYFGDKPKIPYTIMHCWLAAMELAPQLCGETGTAAVAYARDDLKKKYGVSVCTGCYGLRLMTTGRAGTPPGITAKLLGQKHFAPAV
ncbi:hypothetical protein Q4R44_08980 [Morganella morganii]